VSSGDETLAPKIVPSATALLLVDMQRCFVDQSSRFAIPGAESLVRTLNSLAEKSRERGVVVIFTAHVLRPDHSNAGTLPELIPDVAEGMIDEDNESAALRDDLTIAAEDIVLRKPRFSAFAGTDLELILRTRGIDTVVIGGVETHICCESTARDASDRGFRVLFLSDGTASGPRPDGGYSDDSQQASLSRIGFFFGEIATVGEIDKALRDAGPV
jgi:nicotinamidase-related amidase